MKGEKLHTNAGENQEKLPDFTDLLEKVASSDVVVYEIVNPTNSDEAKQEFLQNHSLITPHFIYGNLDETQISSNVNTIMSVHKAINDSGDNLTETEKRLINVLNNDVAKKNLFIQTCVNYQRTTNPTERAEIAKKHQIANEALYGVPDETTFFSLLSSELAKIHSEQLSLEDKSTYDSLINDIGEIKLTKKDRFVPKPETVKRFSEMINFLFENFWTHIPEDKDNFTTREACDIVNEIIQEEIGDDATDYRAVMSDTAKSVSVNHIKREIIFPINRSTGDFSRLGLQKIIAHELCTHAYRALVYEEHPIAAFSHELPGNEEIDEGIAKCCEQAVAGKYSDSGIEHYINIGLANFKGKNFREIFEIQQKLLYLQKCKPDETPEAKAARFHEKDSAIFSRTTRCFRGTGELPNNKDLVYYNGANRVWKYIEDHIDDPDLLDSLFLSGKSDIFDPDQRRLVYESKVGKI